MAVALIGGVHRRARPRRSNGRALRKVSRSASLSGTVSAAVARRIVPSGFTAYEAPQIGQIPTVAMRAAGVSNVCPRVGQVIGIRN
jgi:hypothetical protein